MADPYSVRFGKLSHGAKNLWRRVVQGTFSFEKNEVGVSYDLLSELVEQGFIKNLTPNKSRFMFTISEADRVYLLRPAEMVMLKLVSDSKKGMTREVRQSFVLKNPKADTNLMDLALGQLVELGFVARDLNDTYTLTF